MGWISWGNWADVPPIFVCNADHACNPEGLLMLCANTLHEAECCTNFNRGTLLAEAMGNLGPYFQTGGSCWAEVVFTERVTLPSKFRIVLCAKLNGKCETVQGVNASLKIFVEVDSLGIDDKVYEVNAAYEPGGIFEWNEENLNNLRSEEYEISSPGEYEVKIRFRGEATVALSGNYAAVEFNDRYGDGFYLHPTYVCWV